MKFETSLLQDPNEFEQFLGLVREHNVRSYLEVGSKHGGSLWRITQAMPRGSVVLSIDLPHGDGSFKESEPHLLSCIDHLCAKGYRAHVIIGDSTDPQVVQAAREMSPFDLCFIDANHTEPYVWKDWNNYRTMARIMAFHDIGFRQLPHKRKEPIEVPRVWDKIKQGQRYLEIKLCKASNGIGVIWQQ